MNAFFFGPAERQLFGYYHAPRGAARGAAVICPSWGPEYQYAHRALRVVARRLAEHGVHVLRFDYSGTGDSWGESTVGHFSQWHEDVQLAIAELQAMSGMTRLDLIGLRFGAFMAASATANRSDVDRLILWDPIIDGASWVRSLNGSRPIPEVDQMSGPVEFAQRLVTPMLVRELSTVSADRYPEIEPGAALVLRTTGTAVNVLESLHQIRNVEHRIIEDASPWLEDTSIWSGLVPTKAVNTVVEWIGAA